MFKVAYYRFKFLAGNGVVVSMFFGDGERCTDNSNYTLSVIITCDPDVPASQVRFMPLANSTTCDIVIAGRASDACPIFSLGWLLDKYLPLFTLVFLGAGLGMTFYGLRLFRYVLFLLGALTIGILTLVNYNGKNNYIVTHLSSVPSYK